MSSNNGQYGHSFATAASHYEEEEVFESLEELEAQTIGNLLPDDDDLLSGVTDGFGSFKRTNNVEDVEDLDLFSSVGGLELGDDSFLQRNTELSNLNSINQLGISLGSNGGEHPFGEHPSRTLFVRNINSNVEDSELRTLFEVSSITFHCFKLCFKNFSGCFLTGEFSLSHCNCSNTEISALCIRHASIGGLL